MKFYIEYKNNKIIRGGSLFKKFFQTLVDGIYLVSIDKRKTIRSLPQNALYWLYLGIISNETGDNVDDLHEFFKRKFIPARTMTILKTLVVLPGTTTTLSKAEFSEYLSKIEVLTGIPIPDTTQYYE